MNQMREIIKKSKVSWGRWSVLYKMMSACSRVLWRLIWKHNCFRSLCCCCRWIREENISTLKISENFEWKVSRFIFIKEREKLPQKHFICALFAWEKHALCYSNNFHSCFFFGFVKCLCKNGMWEVVIEIMKVEFRRGLNEKHAN